MKIKGGRYGAPRLLAVHMQKGTQLASSAWHHQVLTSLANPTLTRSPTQIHLHLHLHLSSPLRFFSSKASPSCSTSLSRLHSSPTPSLNHLLLRITFTHPCTHFSATNSPAPDLHPSCTWRAAPDLRLPSIVSWNYSSSIWHFIHTHRKSKCRSTSSHTSFS